MDSDVAEDTPCGRHRLRPPGQDEKAFHGHQRERRLVLQALYNLSDEAMEFQMRDRFSFLRFLALHIVLRS
ncbi:MAG: transposase [Synergistaceae bacterium]|nr:transposase [Synergistaceae bacterium]